MMTHLRYWAVVGFLLLSLGITAGLGVFSGKWTHVIVGFLALPLLWSWHYLRKKKLGFRDPETRAGALLLITLIGALVAGNAYAALLGWFSLVVGLVVFLGVRSLTPEHRVVLHLGMVSIGVLWVGWSLLALHTALPIPWLPVIGKDPVALAALGIVPLAAGILLLKRQAVWKNVAIVLGCALLTIPFTLPSFFSRVHEDWQAVAKFTPSVSKIIQAYPWLGVGSANVQYLYPRFATTHTVILQQAPSSVLDILLSFGFIGVILLVGLLATSLVGLRGQPKRTQAVLLLAVVAVQALCWAANLWQYPALWLSWWVLLGLCASPTVTNEVQDKSTRRAFRYSMLAFGALVALQAIVMGLGLNRFAAAERAAQTGDTKTAATLYALSLRFDPDPEQRRAYAESLWLNTYQSKDLSEAEHQARLAYDWNRHDAFARQVGARIAFSAGRNADAERLYQETLERDPVFSLDVYVALADVYKKQGKLEAERAILQQGLAQYPASPTVAEVAYPVFLDQLRQMRERLQAIPKPK